MPLAYRMAQLRRGRGWTVFGSFFAAVCWGIWAASSLGSLGSPMVTLVITSLVAVGLFSLARLLGRVFWERQLGRVRRSARIAHLVTGVFLVGVGVAFLRQTDWFVTAWNWVIDQAWQGIS
jgi:cytochrome c biogenesis protein CcdA